MKAAMNIDMPMAKGIVDQEFLEKNNVVQKRRAVNPLGNFWKQNLNQIFKDFWGTVSEGVFVSASVLQVDSYEYSDKKAKN